MAKLGKMKITEDFTPLDLEVTGFQDENGQPFSIKDSAGSATPGKLIVIVESTHTGINRNLVEYTMNGLENSVSSWTDNYNKPVLLNHNPYSDNIGRVKKSEYCQSVIDSSKYCIKLTLEITNQAAIERFLDGRYKTFSIGGYTDSARCSICGKDQMEDGWCGHRRGKKYDGKECYWTLGKMEYDEISVVNCPADPNAQAIDIKIITNEPQTDGTNPDTKPGQTTDLFDQMDGLLGINQPEGTEPQTDGTQPQTDGADGQGDEPNEPEGADGGQSDGNDNNNGDTKSEDAIAQLQAQLAERDATIAELTQKNTDSETTISDLQAQLTQKDEAATATAEELQLVKDEKEALVQQNVQFARFSHQLLCDKVADLQILTGAKQADEKEGLVKEYATLTTKALNDMAQEIMTAAPQHDRRGSVANPTQVGSDDSEDGATKDNATDMEKFEEAFSQFFRQKI